MFIHLGGDKVIRSDELVAIFDISIEESSKISKQFLTYANEQTNNVELIGEEDHKSMVVSKHKIYYSPVSSATLKKRASQLVMS